MQSGIWFPDDLYQANSNIGPFEISLYLYCAFEPNIFWFKFREKVARKKTNITKFWISFTCSTIRYYFIILCLAKYHNIQIQTSDANGPIVSTYLIKFYINIHLYFPVPVEIKASFDSTPSDDAYAMIVNFESSIDTFTIVKAGSFPELDSDVTLNGPSVSFIYEHPEQDTNTLCSTTNSRVLLLIRPEFGDREGVCITPGPFRIPRGRKNLHATSSDTSF